MTVAAGDFRITPGDSLYPEDLRALGESLPPSLWLRGSPEILQVEPRVAIVGTRRATQYGLRVTRELATHFVRAGACIVSGLASGIDGEAHRAALDAGGATVAVLGTGLDYSYPRANRRLQRTIAERGLLVTELDHSDHGMRFTFVHRNRIIAALSRLTIVVEAGTQSGALNTAEHAAGMGRPFAAVPGNIDQPQSVGANRLLGHGALVVGSVEDALAMVGLTPPPRVPRCDPDGDEGKVWSALAAGGLDMDTLCSRSGLPAARCMAAVTQLEIGGSVECAMTGEIRRR